MKIKARIAVFAPVVAMLTGCAHGGPFVWVESLSLPPAAEIKEYVIGPGDLLNIQVWEQPAMLTRGKVRDDGKISFPLLHDVTVAGKTPDALAADLEGALKAYMLAPRVNVVVEEPRPLTVSLLGQVARPGQYVMDRGAGVAQVLAAGGGLTLFAHKDRIFVIRESGEKHERVRFKFESLMDPSSAGGKFQIRRGDVVVVE